MTIVLVVGEAPAEVVAEAFASLRRQARALRADTLENKKMKTPLH